jgi:phosphoribosylaminoimidazole-succinocarboxamide synthase
LTGIALPHAYTGKVRDLYDVDHDRMLIVASDRISVFDVVLDDLVPDKGRTLTALSTFWFEETAGLVPNHLISSDPTDFPETAGSDVAGRAMLVRATQPVRLECIGRGYLFGSAWSERLPEPIFTATTKAESGHDKPLTDTAAAELVGGELLEQIRDITLRVYGFGAGVAEQRGLILADTKLEFGTVDGELLVIDEMLTPDSSRYWPADDYRIGTSPPSFDKQFVRDYYLGTDWDHTPPAPRLPSAVIDGTRTRYVEAYELLTGRSFDEWHRPEETGADDDRQYD